MKVTFPKLEIKIRKIFGNSASFNITGNVFNLRRCRQDPTRADKRIQSSFWYKLNLAADQKPPRLLSFFAIENVNTYDDDEIKQMQQEVEEAAAWEVFFEEAGNSEQNA